MGIYFALNVWLAGCTWTSFLKFKVKKTMLRKTSNCTCNEDQNGTKIEMRIRLRMNRRRRMRQEKHRHTQLTHILFFVYAWKRNEYLWSWCENLTHKLSFILLTFVILTSLLCEFAFYFYSNLHPTSKSRSHFFLLRLNFLFFLFSFSTWRSIVVHRMPGFVPLFILSSNAFCSVCACVFLYISFSIPQLPPPFTCCSLHSICYVLFLPSIPLHIEFTLLFSFIR